MLARGLAYPPRIVVGPSLVMMIERHAPRRSRPGAFVRRLARRAGKEFRNDHCPQLAAAIAYHVLFSIFPLAIVLVGLLTVVLHAAAAQAEVLDAIVRNVPLSAEGKDQLRSLLDGATSGPGALGLLGIIGLVWSASGMMAAIRLALNLAWDTKQTRRFVHGKLIDVLLIFAVALLALLSLGLTVLVRVVARYGSASGLPGPLGAGADWATWLLGALVPLLLAFAAILFLYRVVPADPTRVRDLWPGALLAATGFVVVQNLFALYLEHFDSYNAVYGSLGAIIAFLFFVYLASNVFLFGGEVASAWPHVRSELQHEPTNDGSCAP